MKASEQTCSGLKGLFTHSTIYSSKYYKSTLLDHTATDVRLPSASSVEDSCVWRVFLPRNWQPRFQFCYETHM